jgi:hypothetical protein
MNKKALTVLSVAVIVVFIAYIIFDVIRPSEEVRNPESASVPEIADAWKITNQISITEGGLKAVTVSPSGTVYLGGDSFLSSYDKDLKLKWNVKMPAPITALSTFGDSIFASTIEQILVVDKEGKILNEWGPFEDSCIITSVSSNLKYVAFADAGNKTVYILDKGGEVRKMIGQNDKQFVIPSPYFDIALDNENKLFTANTGHHRIETRTIDGLVKSSFGEPGSAPERFAGCCAPPHFALIPEGFVTSEKGINRIKILNKKGEFVEFVNSKNSFVKSIPLDVASADGVTIYGANPADSKLYVFERK